MDNNNLSLKTENTRKRSTDPKIEIMIKKPRAPLLRRTKIKRKTVTKNQERNLMTGINRKIRSQNDDNEKCK